MIIAGTRPRLLLGVAGAMSWQPRASDGEPATVDPGAITVGVTTSDGVDVIAPGTATTGTGTDARSIAIPLAAMAQLDALHATWKSGTTTVAETAVDIVGGYYFDVADMRLSEPTKASPLRDSDPSILAARAEIESLVESVCGMAFVPRFDVHKAYTNRGIIVLPTAYVRRVRWARWRPANDGGTFTSLDVIDTTGSDDGIVTVPVANAQVEIGYEHGLDACPADLRRAVMVAARAQGNLARSGIPDRATSMQLDGGGVVTLATPGVGKWHTGIPVVDEVLMRYAVRQVALG